VTAEFTGTLFLVATVVGSGIMGECLAGGNVAIALLANTLATGAALVALILVNPGDIHDKYKSRGDGVPRPLEARDSRSGIGIGRIVEQSSISCVAEA